MTDRPLNFKKYPLIPAIIILGIAGFNGFHLLQSLPLGTQPRTSHNQLLLQTPGLEYLDFRPFLNQTTQAGFLTDKPMNPENNDGQFLAAQYILAPTRLELNNPQNSMFLIDATSLPAAMRMLKDVHASPVYVNPYGKVLAHKP